MKLRQLVLIGAAAAVLSLCTPLHALYLSAVPRGGVEPSSTGDLPIDGEAICDTDEDCARHCPPPADEPDCDGGPEGREADL